MSQDLVQAADRGKAALDAALLALGYPAVSESTDVRMADPVVGDLENAVIEKSGSAPFRFVFGLELDVWVGPFSEVVSCEVLNEPDGYIRDLIEGVLRSEVSCASRGRSVRLTLNLPGQGPWLRQTVRGTTAGSMLEQRYSPYALKSDA